MLKLVVVVIILTFIFNDKENDRKSLIESNEGKKERKGFMLNYYINRSEKEEEGGRRRRRRCRFSFFFSYVAKFVSSRFYTLIFTSPRLRERERTLLLPTNIELLYFSEMIMREKSRKFSFSLLERMFPLTFSSRQLILLSIFISVLVLWAYYVKRRYEQLSSPSNNRKIILKI